MKGIISSPFKRQERTENSQTTRKNMTLSISDLCESQIEDYRSSRIFRDHDYAAVRDFLMVSRKWESVCGALLCGHLKPRSLVRGILSIEASSGIFLEQARFMSRELQEKISRTLPEIQIQEIRFTIGNFKGPSRPSQLQAPGTEGFSLKQALEQLLRETKA